MPELSHKSLAARLLHLLRQGLTPEKLALSLALGAGLSCFPVFGATTLLCTAVALASRLNLPAIQVGNYLALPLQLGLFIPFLRLGERLVRAPRMLLSPPQLLALAKAAPSEAVHILLSGQWHAIIGWAVIAPEMVLLLTLLLRPVMRLLVTRAGRSPKTDEIVVRR